MTTPIKRNKHLAWLSRDHHDGLLIVWKVRQGIKHAIAADRIVSYVCHAFVYDLEPHFREEEAVVFIQLPSDDALRLEAEEHHAALREKMSQLEIQYASTDTLQLFANLLEEHIRFEERTLFPHIEQEVSYKKLEEIGRVLAKDHSKKTPTSWQDEFWMKGN